MKKNIAYQIIILLLMMVTFVFYAIISQSKIRALQDQLQNLPTQTEKIDTIINIVPETCFIAKPIETTKTVIKLDTVRVWNQFSDDSLDVTLNHVQKQYNDTNYTAWVSGYQDVWLDSLKIYGEKRETIINKEITKYITKKQSNFGLSVTAGPVYDLLNKKASLGICVGLSYKIK